MDNTEINMGLEKQLAARDMGGRIEQRTIGIASGPVLESAECNLMKEWLTQAGIKMELFESGSKVKRGETEITHTDAEKNGTLKSQAEFVLAALGKSKMKVVVSKAVEQAINQPGGDIADKGGEALPFIEIAGFIEGFLHKSGESGFEFDPGKASGQVEWKKKLLFRMEAVISSTYAVLRTIAEGEHGFQEGRYANKFLKQRVIEGELRARRSRLGEETAKQDAIYQRTQERLSKDKEGKKAIIRHLPPQTLPVILEQLVA